MTEIRWLIVAADGRLYHSVVAAAVHAALHKSLAGRKGEDGRWSSRAAQTIENDEKPGCERIPVAMRRREGKGREGKGSE